MRWRRLREAVTHRRDATALCRRYGYESVEDLLGDAAAADVADPLVADLVTVGPVGVEVALAVLARGCAAAPGGRRRGRARTSAS